MLVNVSMTVLNISDERAKMVKQQSVRRKEEIQTEKRGGHEERRIYCLVVAVFAR